MVEPNLTFLDVSLRFPSTFKFTQDTSPPATALQWLQVGDGRMREFRGLAKLPAEQELQPEGFNSTSMPGAEGRRQAGSGGERGRLVGKC